MSEKIVRITNPDSIRNILGAFDCNAEIIEKELGVTVSALEDGIKISGQEYENVNKGGIAVEYLSRMAEFNTNLGEQNIRYVLGMVMDGEDGQLSELSGDCICITTKGKPIKAKTVGQKQYVDAIKKNTVIFGVGPAGTGKTFLAVAMAVNALREKQVSRIILTRPAVEAGEKLGFLPGDLQNKIDPYLRPLYDALFEMLGAETFEKYKERGVIEIAPLAYMRGRTLDDSFIILDEAQNTTPEQMKMFLTRFGFGSKAVVTGDITQIDLPDGKRSGLIEATKILRNIEGIWTHRFTDKDVVRHALVQKIIQAYEKHSQQIQNSNK
ncbi:MAG: PhoH family protein [Clostridia bacterium]|nr:PhoH family protein [Clostridia bacterium]